MLALIAASSASAQRVAEPDFVPGQKEIRAFEKTKISLAQAIKIAAHKHKDARVVDVSFDIQSDQLAYKIKTYRGSEVWEGAIDAWTGEMLGDGTTTPVSKLDDEDKLELAGLLTASIDLAKATALAEEKGLGRAISAGLRRDKRPSGLRNHRRERGVNDQVHGRPQERQDTVAPLTNWPRPASLAADHKDGHYGECSD